MTRKQLMRLNPHPQKERVRQQIYADSLADTFCLKGVHIDRYATVLKLGRAYFSPINFSIVGSMAAAQISYPFSLGWSRSGMIDLDNDPS
jgi:hypothetical protein